MIIESPPLQRVPFVVAYDSLPVELILFFHYLRMVLLPSLHSIVELVVALVSSVTIRLTTFGSFAYFGVCR